MLDIFKQWYQRHFTDPQAVILLMLLVLGAFVIVFMGTILAPVIAAMVIAFVLEWLVTLVQRFKVPRVPAFYIVYCLFIGLFLFTIFALIPLLWRQTQLLIEDAPRMLTVWQTQLNLLPERYPEIFSQAQIDDLIGNMKSNTAKLGQTLLSMSLSSIPWVITFIVYVIIVPLMVFFFMKDRDDMKAWFSRLLPDERGLTLRVWKEVHDQLGNYIIGKVGEVIIVGTVSCIVYVFLDLKYAILLGAITGLSVLVPYVGAAVVAIPVVAMGLFQFGFTPQFWYVAIAYAVIQAIDGNVLAPLLFSEAVSMHPVAIIVAIVFFGGIWGLWGVFFAIPLAILVKSVLEAWP
jgi:putative permease